MTKVRDAAFFFKAEDGIRAVAVTGVQTCALPISQGRSPGNRCVGKPGLDKGEYLADDGLEPTLGIVEIEQRRFRANKIFVPQFLDCLERQFEQEVPCDHGLRLVDGLLEKSRQDFASRNIQGLLKKDRMDEVI